MQRSFSDHVDMKTVQGSSRNSGRGKISVKRNRLSLFALPTELWIYIVELALIPDGPVKAFSTLSVKRNETTVMQPAISRTCRVLREHAQRLFYENTTFIVYYQNSMPFQLVSWLTAIGWANRARIKRLYVKCPDQEDLQRIDEYCIEMGITLPFRKEFRDKVTGMCIDQLSFIEEKDDPGDDDRLQEVLDFFRTTRERDP